VGRRRHSVSCKASQFANTTTIEKAIHVIVAFKAEYLVSGALERIALAIKASAGSARNDPKKSRRVSRRRPDRE
jgi:hypothetical protein